MSTTRRAPESVAASVRRGGRALVLFLAACVAGCVSPGSRERFDLGPVVTRDQDAFGRERLRALGPLFETDRAADGRTLTAARPLVSRSDDPLNNAAQTEVLWPAVSISDHFGETFWWALPSAFGHDFDNSAPHSRYRVIVLPVYFSGRDKDGEKYFALFPLGGTIHEFFGQDRIMFVLFPLYGYTKVNQVESRNILWPIIGWTRGPGVHRFRIFPIYGRSYNAGRWTKHFVLWPIWTSVEYAYPGDKGGGFILFPLVGHVRTTNQVSWMFLPPLIKWAKNNQGHMAINMPWPFVQYESGEINKLYLWPFWGQKDEKHIHSSFWLWPVVGSQRTERTEEVLKRFHILPLAFYESRTKMPRVLNDKEDLAQAQADYESAVRSLAGESAWTNGRAQHAGVVAGGGGFAPDVTTRYFKLWPLFSYLREGDSTRLRTLALWPLKRTAAIERNWAPLWTLYSRIRVGQTVENEVMWGLFRHGHENNGGSRTSLFPLFSTAHNFEGTDERRWALLGGLVGYEREGLRRRLRLLYFIHVRLGRDAAASPVATRPAQGEGDLNAAKD